MPMEFLVSEISTIFPSSLVSKNVVVSAVSMELFVFGVLLMIFLSFLLNQFSRAQFL